MNSFAAMSLSRRPALTSRTTSCSAGVSGSQPGGYQADGTTRAADGQGGYGGAGGTGRVQQQR
jgi:hypothetical protein